MPAEDVQRRQLTCPCAAQSNQGHNFNQTITIPKSAPKGSNIMSASLMSLLGAESEPVLANFNVTVTFGDHFSQKYVSSSDS